MSNVESTSISDLAGLCRTSFVEYLSAVECISTNTGNMIIDRLSNLNETSLFPNTTYDLHLGYFCFCKPFLSELKNATAFLLYFSSGIYCRRLLEYFFRFVIAYSSKTTVSEFVNSLVNEPVPSYTDFKKTLKKLDVCDPDLFDVCWELANSECHGAFKNAERYSQNLGKQSYVPNNLSNVLLLPYAGTMLLLHFQQYLPCIKNLTPGDYKEAERTPSVDDRPMRALNLNDEESTKIMKTFLEVKMFSVPVLVFSSIINFVCHFNKDSKNTIVNSIISPYSTAILKLNDTSRPLYDKIVRQLGEKFNLFPA